MEAEDQETLFRESAPPNVRKEEDLVAARFQVEHDAVAYRSQLSGPRGDVRAEQAGDADENGGIEVDELELLIVSNDSLADEEAADMAQKSANDMVTGLRTVIGRDPVLAQEWGEDHEARYLQEQRNIVVRCSAVNGIVPRILVHEPPSGPDDDYIVIPTTIGQFLAMFDALKLSQGQSFRHLYPESAFDMDIQQLMLAHSCPRVDRNPFCLSNTT
ncbi:hypothetical protein QFC19_007721 [Naganishia cerealis]|uniref:Uncharacterized protein n=1 Tax=Naganishia cerealis TaxID=610337 RepID=A0ACC2V846_9TREE|nr:hypothetical protein QFC19_007721 [Naganishia cerealis]